MTPQPLHLRVFISSPGDVADERGIALTVIDRLQYDPLVRGAITFDVVAWDKPGAGTPLLASVTPQAAIDSGLARPSECDIVVVLFWSRMGTPLPYPAYRKPGGEAFQSGTEWEFEEALAAARQHGRPDLLVYRRVQEVLINAAAPDAEDRLRQVALVRAFFDRLGDSRSGAILHGYNAYQTPDDFRQQFEVHLRSVIKRLLASASISSPLRPPPAASTPPLWRGSPFPGLRAFTPRDAPIFFGRGRETDELLRRLASETYVDVVGSSGSGKSSIVGAGIIPRLAGGAVPDVPEWLLPTYDDTTRQWEGVRFTPGEVGDNPFIALALRLAPLVGGLARDIAHTLRRSPAAIADYVAGALAKKPAGAHLLMFIDQFEELFTLVDPVYTQPFVDLLVAASQVSGLRTVATTRSDFYYRCLELPSLARLLERGQFPLGEPTDTLGDMIARPAQRAGMQFEEGLPGRILRDTQRQPGALPLLAYTLDELYRAGQPDGLLTHAAYARLGGVAGAVGTRAEAVFGDELDEVTREAFSPVFRELVEVEEHGRVTRRRALLRHVARDDRARRFVDVFAAARLFVTSATPGAFDPVVEVAHEALFESWPRLHDWLRTVEDDLRLLQKVKGAAQDWHEHGRDEAYFWPHERLVPVYQTFGRLQPELDEVTRAFAQPEYIRLLTAFSDPDTENYRRQALADRLVAIGANTIPGLLERLRSTSPMVRNAASAALARFDDAAVPGLVEALHDQDAEVRLNAVEALRIVGGQPVVPGLLTALRDPDARVYSLAAGALATIDSPEALAGAAEALDDPRVDVRWRAVGILGQFGNAGVRSLVGSLRDWDTQVRTLALDALTAMGGTAAPQLVELLSDPDGDMRWGAAEALVAIGEASLPAVLMALTAADGDVRCRATEILSGIGDRHSVPSLCANLDSPDVAVRRLTVDALGVLGDPEAAGQLARALTDRDVDVRWAAGEALRGLGETAIPELLSSLRARTMPDTPAIAAKALSGLGEAAVPGLVEALRHPHPATYLRAADALSNIGPRALPAILESLGQLDDQRLEVMTGILAGFDVTGAPALIDLLAHPTPRVRALAAAALGTMGERRASDRLLEALEDAEEQVRTSAANALARMGEPGVARLARSLRFGGAPARVAAAAALVQCGGEVVPHLAKLLRADDQEVVRLARGVLQAVATPLALSVLAERHTGSSTEATSR